MTRRDQTNFFYLNREGRWKDVKKSNLQVHDDGSLRLESLPQLSGDMPEGLDDLPAPDGPAGVAIGEDNTVYYSDPDGHQLFLIDPCNGSLRAVPCLNAGDDEHKTLCEPRGLCMLPARRALVIADSGNHRLVLLDPYRYRIRDIWGGFGTEPGRFDNPWSVASDSDGNIYVVDYGNGRVQKFDLWGNVIPSFWETAREETELTQPSEVATYSTAEVTRICVLEPGNNTVIVLDPDGHMVDTIPLSGVQEAAGLFVDFRNIYVGDNDQRRLLKLEHNGALVGQASGYLGPVAALGATEDTVWVHPGSGAAPVRLDKEGAYVRRGAMWGGPFGAATSALAWHRLTALLASPLESSTRFRFYVYTSNANDSPPEPAADAVPEHPWKGLPADVHDVLVDETSNYLWVAAYFEGDGTRSPCVKQIKVSYDHQTYSQHLPAIYQRKAPEPAVLDRFLSLFESFFVDVEDEIAALDRLFDPAAVPADWLDWLAGWLALQLEEEWSEDKKRQAIAEAFGVYALRGTARGLRQALQFYASVDARIQEPLLHSAWWALPGDTSESSPANEVSILGFNTRLVSASPQGAVVGRSAVTDGSHLIAREEFGSPLFEETAHQFCVQLFPAQVKDSDKLDEVTAVIEREKPAHTLYHVCVIKPSVRVGLQACVGVDTLVGGGVARPSELGETSTLTSDAVLAGAPTGRLGERSRLGQTTHVGEGLVGFDNCVPEKQRPFDERKRS